MKVNVTVPHEIDLKYLRATMGVRYWTDCDYSEDNGKTWYEDFDDTDEESERIKKLIPHVVRKDIGYRESDYWELVIDLDKGKVLDWPKGFCLNTYFKVCDDGEYAFFDKDMNEIINITKQRDQYYVPDFLALEDSGYGDYVIINIDGGGNIKHFDDMKERIEYYFEEME
jgi:hypothetical protein